MTEHQLAEAGPQNAADDLDLVQLAEGLHRLRIPTGPAHLLNSYLWVGEEGVTLIDTGWPESEALIGRALARLDRSPVDVRRVVLTHFHDDHAGAAAAVRGWSDKVEVLVGEPDAAFVTGSALGPIPDLTARERELHPPSQQPPQAGPCTVDGLLRDGDVLPFGGGCQVLATPGHTAGSVALFLPAAGALLTGDTFAEFGGEIILGVFNLDRESMGGARERLAATGAEVAGFGHGEACVGRAAERIRTATDPFA